MRRNLRRLVAVSATTAILGMSDIPAAVSGGRGSLDGSLVAVDGRPAVGWSVLLLDAGGNLAARAAANPAGEFSFAGVSSGSYRLAVEDTGRILHPVLAPAVRLPDGARVRRDIRLLPKRGTFELAPAAVVAGDDSWWDRQTRNQKIYYTVGFVLGAGVLAALVSDALSDDEPAASPSQ